MESAIRFPQQFDIARLTRDLRAAEQMGVDHPHWDTGGHDGGWSAIPLVAPAGRTDASALEPVREPCLKTPVLQACPYFEEIIDSFRCGKERVRLMRLKAGTHIFAHSDGPRYSWVIGAIARMHIPIVTHESVRFMVDGRRVVMEPGELWYVDTSRRHQVDNAGQVDRVHLVIDLVMDAWVRAMFPTEPLWQRSWNVSRRTSYRLKLRLRAAVKPLFRPALR